VRKMKIMHTRECPPSGNVVRISHIPVLLQCGHLKSSYALSSQQHTAHYLQRPSKSNNHQPPAAIRDEALGLHTKERRRECPTVHGENRVQRVYLEVYETHAAEQKCKHSYDDDKSCVTCLLVSLKQICTGKM